MAAVNVTPLEHTAIGALAGAAEVLVMMPTGNQGPLAWGGKPWPIKQRWDRRPPPSYRGYCGATCKNTSATGKCAA